jgi:hypothetical protein
MKGTALLAHWLIMKNDRTTDIENIHELLFFLVGEL